LSQELGIDRKHLLERRHKLQNFVDEARIRMPPPDTVTECDEMYQNAGEEGIKHPNPTIRLAAEAIKLAVMARGTLTGLRFWGALAEKADK